jgi:hypothetical protein
MNKTFHECLLMKMVDGAKLNNVKIMMRKKLGSQRRNVKISFSVARITALTFVKIKKDIFEKDIFLHEWFLSGKC